MSWLNFNDSLNTIKGQITNLAQTVLAEDDEGSKDKCNDCEELKKICAEKELEIEKLKRNNENLNKEAVEDPSKNENWNWVNDEAQNGNCIPENNSKEVLDLKRQLDELKNENKDLVNQLELLDLDNQKNYTKLIGMKEKIQEELEELRDENNKLQKQYRFSLSKEEGLQTEINRLLAKLKDFEIAKDINESFEEKYNSLLIDYEQIKKQIKSSSEHDKESERNSVSNVEGIEDKNDIVIKLLEKYQTHINNLDKSFSEIKIHDNSETCNTAAISNIKKELDSTREFIGTLATSLRNDDTDKKDVLESLQQCNFQATNIANLNKTLTEIQEDKVQLLKQNEELLENHSAEMINRHNKYMAIIEEIVEKLNTFENISEFNFDLTESDSHILELKKQMEYIYKMFLDMKSQIVDISKEKTRIMSEKNQEIQKLMETSDSLSKEVIQKTQLLKEYENEIKELEKNNELILIELEAYKTSPLETISESNEDKVVLLEEQLETANDTIDSLNKTIEDIQTMKNWEDMNIQTDCTLSHLNSLEKKVKENNDNYTELLDKYDKFQIDYDFLKSDLDSAKEELKFANEEYLSLKSLSETSKINSDNIQQELDKALMKNRLLQDEIEINKEKAELLLNGMEKLQFTNDESLEVIKKELDVYKESLSKEYERNRHLEENIEHLTEKLKNAKMIETSLKLQYDTLGKEVVSLNTTKSELEDSLSKTNAHLHQVQNDCTKIQNVNVQLTEDYEKLKQVLFDQEEQLKNSQQTIKNLNEELLKREVPVDKEVIKADHTLLDDNEVINNNNEESKNMNRENELDALKLKFEETNVENDRLKIELSNLFPLQNNFKELLEQYNNLKKELEELSNSRNELIKLLTEKHQENISYHSEIQRLMQILTAENLKNKNLDLQLTELKNSLSNCKSMENSIEKLTDENNFLKEKCGILTENLLKEQAKYELLLTEKNNNSSEEQLLKRNLERLQEHLIEVEEHYTQELLQVEERNKALQIQVNEMEKREKSSSTLYTSVNIRANQQVESLQNQLQAMSNERNSLRQQVSDSEDVINKQAAALTNLQLVLEQFRKDKEKEVHKETERLRRHINSQKQQQEDLNREIASLKSQLQESKQGLLAASRLSDQLEYSKKTINALKQEVTQLQEQLEKKEEELNSCKTQTDGKVDKFLLKNLIIGFVSCNNKLNKDQYQILRIIATVLDFSQEDHEKINLDKKSQGSWLSSLLAPQANDQSMPRESLSKAFIEFLENESKPKVIPNLLNVNPDPVKMNSTSSTPKGQSPANLSEIVLPTFTDFGQNRNSSSILKDVLKHNN